jgi:pyrroloquinoline quinone (PQQ) biosynthesis protein C
LTSWTRLRQFDLNEHPFYVEWRAGTLPIERLAEYAASFKLAGLREHYAGTVDADAQQYFVEHAVETDEPAMLASLIDGLSDGEFARAKTACATFSAAAWGALDGVYYTD